MDAALLMFPEGPGAGRMVEVLDALHTVRSMAHSWRPLFSTRVYNGVKNGAFIMRIAILCLFVGLSFPSQSAEVLRCEDESGHVTFTNTGDCPDGTISQHSTLYVPERNRRSSTWAEEEAKQAKAFGRGSDSQRSNHRYISRDNTRRGAAWEEECRKAKAIVIAQKAHSRTPTYDDRRRWNDIEYSACKGRTPSR